MSPSPCLSAPHAPGLRSDRTILMHCLDINRYWPCFVLRYRFEQSMGKHSLFVFLDCTDINSDLPLWPQLKSAITLLPHSWHLHFLFVFESRNDMLQCAADVVPSLVGPSEVRYAIPHRGIDFMTKYWFEATLDFEELKGMSVALPAGFVPICLCRLWVQRPDRRISRLASVGHSWQRRSLSFFFE